MAHGETAHNLGENAMGQLGFYFDMTRCTGCRCCQIACKDKNDLPVGTLFREVSDFEGGVFPQVWAASLSMACNHCMEPQCAQNCPVAAYSKDPETGLVLQDTWIKRGTVRENICFGKPDATEEDMIRAAKEAHSYEFIRRLPKGFDTVLSEDSISQGQKQLLCITRVMLTLPPMLILDEATSNIDTRTEVQIQEAFDKLMKGRTSFVVAHRLSTIRAASVILVMRDGKIIEKGTHEELLAAGGFYHTLYNSQFDTSGKH